MSYRNQWLSSDTLRNIEEKGFTASYVVEETEVNSLLLMAKSALVLEEALDRFASNKDDYQTILDETHEKLNGLKATYKSPRG